MINLVAGALLLFWPSITVTVIVWLLGIELVLTGILGLIASTQVPKDLGKSGIVVQALVAIVLGIVIMAWPSATLSVLAVLAAIVLILLGVMLLVLGLPALQGTGRGRLTTRGQALSRRHPRSLSQPREMMGA